MESFCERLKSLRDAAGLCQQDMAGKLGITRAGYQMIENGRNGKKFSYLPVIAKSLGCRIDDLFPEMDDVASAPEQTEEERKTARACGFEENDELEGWSE